MLLLLSLIAIIVLLVIYTASASLKNLNHWKELGVKYVKPLPLVGNMLPTLINSKSMADMIMDIYNSFPLERYLGIYQFNTPVLVLRDPELIKSITIKNFDNFVDHTGFLITDADPLWGKSLFVSKGERWRDLRQTLTPIFTGSKLRAMFVLMEECAQQMVHYYEGQKDNVIRVELKDVFTRYTNDVIATTAFGIKCDSLKHKNNEFLLLGKDLIAGITKFKFLVYGSFPKLANLLKIKIIGDRAGNFFRKIIDETIAIREDKNIVRPDLIHLLMLSRKGKLKYEDYLNLPTAGFGVTNTNESENGKVDHKANYLSNEDITAQALLFFIGGYDTVSSGISLVAYELAVNPSIQERLRREIIQTHRRCEAKITYEALLGIKYLDMVVSETFRKWPQAIWLDRKCTKTFEIEPERSGESNLKVNVGDVCWIPVFGIHRDPKYFPNPEVFDPERFNEANSENIQPGTYLPFGIGPRNCIGNRFALLATKILLYYFLLDFEFVPTEKTQIPLKLKKDTAMLMAEKDFHLGLKRSAAM